MDRRHYLRGLLGLTTFGLAGCAGQPGGPATEQDPSSTPATTTARSSNDTLTAGDYRVSLSNPRVRPSIRDGTVHLDVRAARGRQFLVVDAETDGTDRNDLPLVLVTEEGSTRPQHSSLITHPALESRIAIPVSVGTYDSAALVLESDGESDRWPLPDGVVAALGAEPDFAVTSFEVPERVHFGDTFLASFTVANNGDRDARFLAEFGHALLSDTDEVTVTVPAGERRTVEKTIEPYYQDNRDTVPVILDWGLGHRSADVTVVEAGTSTASA